jgi:hypothetical protein
MTQVLEKLRLAVAVHLDAIQDTCKQFGLGGIRNLTLVARDPDNPEMYIVLTNEDDPAPVMELLPEKMGV